VSTRYEFIDAEKAARTPDGRLKYPVVKMCAWLEVSTSGYYEWCHRPKSATAARRECLRLLIQQIFDDSDATYGYRRVHAQLARQGERCTPELVRSIMRDRGLVPCQPRPWRHSLTDQAHSPAPVPDLVRRDFTAAEPGFKMVGDITYIPTWQGWVYLATVIDCCTKEVIGWAVDDNYKTPLITAAIAMAARNRTLVPGAVFHSDRGSNYMSDEYGKVLKDLGIGSRLGGPVSVMTMRWRSRSSPRSRTSGCIGRSTRPENTLDEILRVTSSCTTISNVSTQDSTIRPRKRSMTSI
jgi:putative transposase